MDVMSTKPEFEVDLDLHFLPAWAQQPATQNRYAKFEGHEDRPARGDRGDRGGPGGNRGRSFDQRGGSGNRGERRGPGAPGGFGGGGGRPPGRGFQDRPRREEPRQPAPLPELIVSLVPEEKGVESLARQIRLTGRAYPIFEIGHLVLKKPERYHVIFQSPKKADGQPAQPLFICNLDETVWLSEADAVRHVLTKHFDTFYKVEKMPTDPPKGTYTFVAQCGMSGAILGPPNYHDYQNKLRKLHADRFSQMPFEMFKSRVKIVRDEAVVKQWLESQSFKLEYEALNLPEPKRLFSRDEVDQHFRETHLPNIIRQVESYTVATPAAREALSGPLQALARNAWEEQKRFPIKVVTLLSQQFAGHGLQFFKVDKTVTHVAVARPHFLDMTATPVSEGIRKIVEFIDAKPGCTRRHLIDALAPSAPAPAGTPAPAPATSTTPAEATPPTPEQEALVANLHWLIHQGHVLEFANGKMETAKRPLPRPVKPEPKKPVAPVAPATPAGETATPVAASPETPAVAAPAAATLTEAAQAEAVQSTPESTLAATPAETTPPAAPAAEVSPEPANPSAA